SCPGSRILPVPGEVTALVLCGGRNAIGLTGEDSVLRFQNFVYGQLDPMGRMLYVAGHDGRIRAVDLVTHEITQTSKDAPLRYRRIMPCSGSMSTVGRLCHVPLW